MKIMVDCTAPDIAKVREDVLSAKGYCGPDDLETAFRKAAGEAHGVDPDKLLLERKEMLEIGNFSYNDVCIDAEALMKSFPIERLTWRCSGAFLEFFETEIDLESVYWSGDPGDLLRLQHVALPSEDIYVDFDFLWSGVPVNVRVSNFVSSFQNNEFEPRITFSVDDNDVRQFDKFTMPATSWSASASTVDPANLLMQLLSWPYFDVAVKLHRT